MIYLVRHGRTEFNAEGRFQGHCDSPLTPLGVAQAHRYGELLARLIGDPADWTLGSSPLGRAVATAEIIALVAENCFTNFLNEAAQTDIDFPLGLAAEAA